MNETYVTVSGNVVVTQVIGCERCCKPRRQDGILTPGILCLDDAGMRLERLLGTLLALSACVCTRLCACLLPMPTAYAMSVLGCLSLAVELDKDDSSVGNLSDVR